MGNRMDSASPIGLLIEAYKSLGLSINIKNPRSYTAPDNIEGTPDVNISGITLEVVEYFPYLGVIYPRRRPLKQKFNTVYAVTAHHSGNCATGSLITTTQGKMVVYKAVCVTTLLYGTEA